MGKRGLLQRAIYAAALMAVALLNFASTQSTIMQATSSTPSMAMQICSSLGSAPLSVRRDAHPDPSQKACPFCAAAHNAPIPGSANPPLHPSVVAWIAYTARPGLGARGPPAFAPSARGPPGGALTI